MLCLLDRRTPMGKKCARGLLARYVHKYSITPRDRNTPMCVDVYDQVQFVELSSPMELRAFTFDWTGLAWLGGVYLQHCAHCLLACLMKVGS